MDRLERMILIFRDNFKIIELLLTFDFNLKMIFFRELEIIFLNWFCLRELFSLLFQSIRAGYKQGESSAGKDAGDKISEPSLFRDKIQSSHHPLPTHPIHRHRAQGAGAVLS